MQPPSLSSLCLSCAGANEREESTALESVRRAAGNRSPVSHVRDGGKGDIMKTCFLKRDFEGRSLGIEKNREMVAEDRERLIRCRRSWVRCRAQEIIDKS